MNFEIEGPSAFLKADGGWVGKLGSALLHFGDRTSSLPKLRAAYAGVNFAFLNQIHSDRVHVIDKAPDNAPSDYAPSDWAEGDALITKTKNLALCIRTADCIPVLISAPKMVAAVHAGWRGLESDIIQKTVLKMRALGADPKDFKAAIGPHIGRKSFEVGRDVSEKLTAVFRKLRFNPSPISQPHPDSEKRLVDMSVLAQAQLIQGGVPEKGVSTLRADTFTNSDFHSHRRDKEASGRQISFIVMK